MAGSINVALIGYAFMGKAHSNAYRQVTPFMSPRLEPRMKVLCGRSQTRVEAAARDGALAEVGAPPLATGIAIAAQSGIAAALGAAVSRWRALG